MRKRGHAAKRGLEATSSSTDVSRSGGDLRSEEGKASARAQQVTSRAGMGTWAGGGRGLGGGGPGQRSCHSTTWRLALEISSHRSSICGTTGSSSQLKDGKEVSSLFLLEGGSAVVAWISLSRRPWVNVSSPGQRALLGRVGRGYRRQTGHSRLPDSIFTPFAPTMKGIPVGRPWKWQEQSNLELGLLLEVDNKTSGLPTPEICHLEKNSNLLEKSKFITGVHSYAGT